MTKLAGDGVALFHVTIMMLAISWVTMLSRLAVRRWLKPEAMGVDDYLMCASLAFFSVTSGLVIACCFHGSGQLSKDLSIGDIQTGTKLFFIAELFYAPGTVLIKSSISVTLLRLTITRRSFTWTLWAIIVACVVGCTIFVVGIANICHPLPTLWGAADGTCNNKLNSSVSYFYSAVSIITDWTLAVLPAILLWPVQMDRRTKVSVAVLLSLGAFASCATIIRLRYLTRYDNPSEFMFSTGRIGLWSIIEEGIGITAGSLPALRPVLRLPIFGGTSRSANLRRRPGRLRTLIRASDGCSREEIMLDALGRRSSEADSQKYVLRESESIVRMDPERRRHSSVG